MKPYLVVTEGEGGSLRVVSPDAGEDFVDRLVRLMNGAGMVSLALAEHTERARSDRPEVQSAMRGVAAQARLLRAAITALDLSLHSSALPGGAKRSAVLQ